MMEVLKCLLTGLVIFAAAGVMLALFWWIDNQWPDMIVEILIGGFVLVMSLCLGAIARGN